MFNIFNRNNHTEIINRIILEAVLNRGLESEDDVSEFVYNLITSEDLNREINAVQRTVRNEVGKILSEKSGLDSVFDERISQLISEIDNHRQDIQNLLNTNKSKLEEESKISQQKFQVSVNKLKDEMVMKISSLTMNSPVINQLLTDLRNDINSTMLVYHQTTLGILEKSSSRNRRTTILTSLFVGIVGMGFGAALVLALKRLP